MTIKEVEKRVTSLSLPTDHDFRFVYDLLSAYGKPKSSITRLENGTYNLSNDRSKEIYWKNNLLFRYVPSVDLHLTIDDLSHTSYGKKHNPRFIVVTDYKQLLAIDTKTHETLDIEINDLTKNYAFFLPWAGMEKSQLHSENLADIKASERMARLYDEIISLPDNISKPSTFYHELNIFFSRLLFCFFAEDTDIFKKNQFTNSLASYTQLDGSDLNIFLDELFKALDDEDKSTYPAHIAAFPYVNGGLFSRAAPSPYFSAKARRLILDCGDLNWSEINPDIFGSMIQAVVHPGQRAALGMHYTSVVNIMKVIEPLFISPLKEEFKLARGNENSLKKLLERIYHIKIFDPACGSGNFLIIAYKELRKLEHQILEELLKDKLAVKLNSGIKLDNFYGIEIDDFAREISVLSLWLAKHQMNIEFKNKFGKDIPLIPLKDAGNIVCGNAAQMNWNDICPNNDCELYIIGNPPYQGARLQDAYQKIDMDTVLGDVLGYKDVDYIFIWFKKSSDYIKSHRKQKAALVSTNSICQGQQVSIMWPMILNNGNEIKFAHTSFKWSNNAKRNAGVSCIVVCIGNKSNDIKYIYDSGLKTLAKNINAYLVDADNIYVQKRQQTISNLPAISFGSMPNDGGHLIFTDHEYKKLLDKHPEISKYFKKFVGANEFIKGNHRWAIWLNDKNLESAMKYGFINDAINKTKSYRLNSNRKSTNKLASVPYRFGEVRYKPTNSIIIPGVSSENREYIPIGYLDNSYIISNAAFAIYDAEPSTFTLLNSRMHMVWTRAVGGQLESRLRYSAVIVYNNFPIPSLSKKQEQMLNDNAFELLDIREKYSDKSLAELYDPKLMPEDLRITHSNIDEVVDRCYRVTPFKNDEDRLSYLFKLYETMITPQKDLI